MSSQLLRWLMLRCAVLNRWELWRALRREWVQRQMGMVVDIQGVPLWRCPECGMQLDCEFCRTPSPEVVGRRKR